MWIAILGFTLAHHERISAQQDHYDERRRRFAEPFGCLHQMNRAITTNNCQET
jgi:hypothetical protein